jgi:hypothetical protein
MTIAKQEFGKRRLKDGIATEAEVHLLGNGSVNTGSRCNRYAGKGQSVTTD